MNLLVSPPLVAQAELVPAAAPQSTSRLLSKHFTALDGLRGVAILTVLATHYSGFAPKTGWGEIVHTLTSGGYLGVSLFFVLSGFLITRILIQTRESARYFSTFYIRRSLRIFPLYFAYLALVVLGGYVLWNRVTGQPYQLGPHLIAYPLYASNLWFEPRLDPSLGHLWSLAIEEQFYLVWPFVVFYTPVRWLVPLCLTGFLGSFACRVGMVLTHCNIDAIYALTPSRMDGLLIGAAIGAIELDPTARERLVRLIRPILIACLILVVPITLKYGFAANRKVVQTAVWGIFAVIFAAIVFWAATSGARNRWLNLPWLRFMGKFSYGIYVWHMAPALILFRYHRPETPLARTFALLGCLAATAALTALSWRYIESPFLRGKKRVTYAT